MNTALDIINKIKNHNSDIEYLVKSEIEPFFSSMIEKYDVLINGEYMPIALYIRYINRHKRVIVTLGRKVGSEYFGASSTFKTSDFNDSKWKDSKQVEMFMRDIMSKIKEKVV